MRKKYKKVCTIQNNDEQFLILGSIITGCIPISAFASLVGIPIGITRSAIWLVRVAKVSDCKDQKFQEQKTEE